ncbi:MAG: hypothetical protein COA77_00485 [Thaumarchaeota archaeon]|nr:MAG: hypothetical protein COA77_00485 [Nitrososphaerota archaeon]
MQFKELTGKQWNTIKPHLPKPSTTGRPKADDRTTINAIIFVLITGCKWIDLPVKYGYKSSAHRRFQDFQQKEIWKKILKCLIASANKSGKINLQKISVDSSSISNKKGTT